MPRPIASGISSNWLGIAVRGRIAGWFGGPREIGAGEIDGICLALGGA
jgi:hypothetical protein